MHPVRGSPAPERSPLELVKVLERFGHTAHNSDRKITEEISVQVEKRKKIAVCLLDDGLF